MLHAMAHKACRILNRFDSGDDHYADDMALKTALLEFYA